MSERKLTNEMKAVLAVFDGMMDESNVKNLMACPEFFEQHLFYDTDWNWAMVVYRKVMIMIRQKQSEYQYLVSDLYCSLLKCHPTPERLAIALYDFIVFYNQNSNV